MISLGNMPISKVVNFSEKIRGFLANFGRRSKGVFMLSNAMESKKKG